MAKITFILKNPNDEITSIFTLIPYGTPIKIGHKTKYNYLRYYISESIEPKYWDKATNRASTKTDAKKGVYKYENHSYFNYRLDRIASQIEKTVLDFKNDDIIPTKEQLKEELDKRVKDKTAATIVTELHQMNLTQFTQHLIDTLSIKKTSLKTYSVVLGNFKGYEKKHKTILTLKNVDIDFYNSFIKYLTELGLGQNTIGTRIKVLKTILNNAFERGLNVSLDYQKRSFSRPSEETESIYLNEDELTAIFKLAKLPKYLGNVRDMFLIGCYTGLRYSDLIRLTKDNITSENTIRIKTQKTEMIVDVPIHARVKQIFEKYDYQLPKPISNQKYNEYIKDVAELAKINDPISTQFRKNGMLVSCTIPKHKLVSSHTARRSFATNAFLADVPTLAIMQITGHKTEKSFMKYIKMSAKDNALKLKTHKFFNPMTASV